MHYVYGERLGACAIPLLSEKTRAAAAAVILVKEGKNGNTP